MMKVSVIIPTYNRPGYLAQAVHSVLQQTHPVFEVLIVDDGSAVIHRARIDALQELDDRISVFHFPENNGVSAARNYGLEKSGGDYILFLDDDDLLHPRMVESNLVFFAADNKAGVVSSGYDIFLDTNSPNENWSNEHQQAKSPEKTLLSWDYGDTSLLTKKPFSALLRKSLQVSACLVRRQAIGPARFPEDLTRGEEHFFWLTLAKSGCSFRINHAQLSYYRLHRFNSLSSPGWRKAALESRLKLLHAGMVTELEDLLAVHLKIAQMQLQFDQMQSLNHLFLAFRILISIPMIPSWPFLLKSIPVKFRDRWRNRNMNKALRSLFSGDSHGKMQ